MFQGLRERLRRGDVPEGKQERSRRECLGVPRTVPEKTDFFEFACPCCGDSVTVASTLRVGGDYFGTVNARTELRLFATPLPSDSNTNDTSPSPNEGNQ